MKNFRFAIAACSLLFAFASTGVSAQDMSQSDMSYQADHDGYGYGRGHGRGRGDHDRGRGRGYYRTWQYAGQISAPIHGAPNAWHPGVNYCGTEYPGGYSCYRYGERCYVNQGYWWDNSRGHNWFNYFVCQ